MAVANLPREPLRAAEAADEAEVDLGLAELGVGRRVGKIAAEQELAAAAEREAVDGRDDGDGEVFDGGEDVGAEVGELLAAVARKTAHHGDVGAGHEGLLALAGDDEAADGACRSGRSDLCDCSMQFMQRGLVEGVERLETAHGQRGDAVSYRDLEVLEGGEGHAMLDEV